MLAALFAGCGRSGPDVQMVLGKATLDDQPLAGATVTFSPVTNGDGLAAIGITDEDGSFRLTAVRGGPPQRGTTIGDYAVSFMKVTHDIPGKPKEVPPPTGPLPVFHLVPEAYENDATSGFRATVKRGLNQGPEFAFDLRSDFRREAAGSDASARRAAP
jgi:hypothetical protein